MGNHDEDEGIPPSLAAEYKKHYGISDSYYSFNFNGVHFLMMNSEIASEINMPRLEVLLTLIVTGFDNLTGN